MSNAEAVPSFRDFNKWSVEVAEYWYALGTGLGVPDDHLTNIEINTQLYRTHERRAFQMLKTWRKQRGASYRKMAGALRELGKAELANSICPSMDDDELCGQAQGPSSTHLASETPEAKRRKTEEIDSGHQAASTSQPAKSLEDPLVRELESILKREYKTREHTYVTPFPWLEDWQLSLKSIYIKVRMVRRKTQRSNQREDNTRDMYEVFKPHEHCEEPRIVLVEGAPGIGKTVFCQKIAADWSKGQIGEAFPSFKILLKLKCRDIMSTADTINAETLKCSIVDQLLPLDASEDLKTALFDYIKTTQSQVLIVLDGLDELKQAINISFLINKELQSWQCKFLLTSRNDPQLRKHCDSLFQIVGFTFRDAKSYINKFFGDGKKGKQRAKYLRDKIGKKSSEDGAYLRDLISNPLTTSLLCFVCEETDGNLPSSKIQLYQELTRCVLTRYYKRKQEEPPVDPVGEHQEDLDALGRLALKGIANDQLHFDEDDFHAEGRATKIILEFGFLCKETSVSRMRPGCSYQFVHKTVQEYFAAVSLCQQLLSGNDDCLSQVKISRVKYEQLISFVLGLLSQKAEAGKQSLVGLVSSLTRHLSGSRDNVKYLFDVVRECADINAEFGEAMYEAVVSSSTWEDLDLSGSKISETDGEYRIVCTMLRENRPLKRLYLYGNNIKDVTTLAESMVSNHTLQYLYLFNNPLLTGLPALARALTHNTTLQGLRLGEEFRDEPAIQELKKQNTRLEIY